MRTTIPAILVSVTLLSACGSTEQKPTARNSESAQTTAGRQPAPTTQNTPPVTSAHGEPSGSSPQRSSSPIDTSALDKKIEEAEAKAKAPNAAQADKLAAATAYLQRANVFYNAGNPSLYKFALRDFRIALRYDPSNQEARAKQDQIVDIYKSLGRPIPELGTEP